MQGPIAQAAALTIHGNDRLMGSRNPVFWPSASVFKFCKDVRFVTLEGGPQAFTEAPFADDPKEWMDALANAGVRRLRLHHVPGNHPLMNDRLSVAFAGGGGRWLIEAQRDESADLWEAKWAIGDRKDPERKIWNVTYGRVQVNVQPFPYEARPLVALKDELRSAFKRAQAFADTKHLEGFAAAFRAGGQALTSKSPLCGLYHEDIAPGSLPLEAKQLLAAAEVGWVFGGMGSWNDLSFPGAEKHEYEDLSDHLFDLMTEAIWTAANCAADLVPA